MATQKSPSIAVYPGSFDPITLGHLDIIRRAHRLFDRLVVAVANPLRKSPLIPLDHRVALIQEVVQPFPNVTVEKLEGLLVDFARAHRAVAIVRGLRAVSDFEYEFKMAWMNRRLCPEVETLFLIPSEAYAFLSSSLVKEIAFLGGDFESLVPPPVARALRTYVSQHKDPGETFHEPPESGL